MAAPFLSVLDQSPVPEGSTPADALANSIDLARHADRLGYHRYWVAEHHNTPALAGSAPEVLIGHIAGATSDIRVGSGGVMLTHYSAYKVAEVFAMLHALHPGRIDLGLGRAPGSDGLTAAALARGPGALGVEYYPSQVQEVVQFLHDEVPADSPFARVHASPLSPGAPEVWLLASSPDSAAIAAHLGLPLSFADFITSDRGPAIVDAYRRQYRPSELHPEPRVSVGVAALCADTAEEADRLAAPVRVWRTALRGQAIPTVARALDIETGLQAAPPEQPGRRPMIIGEPAAVHGQLLAVADEYGADELVVVTITHDHAARVRSYELLAEAFALQPRC